MPTSFIVVIKHMTAVAIAMAVAVTGQVANAADVQMVTKGSSRFLIIKGAIESGDYRKVVDAIADDGNHNAAFLLRSRGVFVDSPGGSLDEALKLSRLFRDIYAKVTVVGQCSSACFLLYAGAVERMAFGELGLHNPYLDGQSANQLSVKPLESELRKAEIATRDLLREFSTPAYLVERMFSRTSIETYRLTYEDVLAIGLHSVGWGQVRVSKCGARPDVEREIYVRMIVQKENLSPQKLQEFSLFNDKVRQCEDGVLARTVLEAALSHINREPTKR